MDPHITEFFNDSKLLDLPVEGYLEIPELDHTGRPYSIHSIRVAVTRLHGKQSSRFRVRKLMDGGCIVARVS